MGLEGSNSPQSPPIPDCQRRSGCEGSSRAREEGEAGRSGGGIAGRQGVRGVEAKRERERLISISSWFSNSQEFRP